PQRYGHRGQLEPGHQPVRPGAERRAGGADPGPVHPQPANAAGRGPGDLRRLASRGDRPHHRLLAAPMAYATVPELRVYMEFPSGDTGSDVDLPRALDAGASWIDWGTGRSFGLTPTSTVARIFAAATSTQVPIVDLQTAAPTVAVDTDGERTFVTTLLPEQYALQPYTGPPFSEVLAWANPAGDVAPFSFTIGQLVRITGQWGYVDPTTGLVPAAVEQANLLLGARWFKRREVPLGVLQNQALDVFEVLPQQASEVLPLLLPVALPGSPAAQAAAARDLAPAGAAA